LAGSGNSLLWAQTGRQILKNKCSLFRSHVHAITYHVVECPVPAVSRSPDRAVEKVERMAADAGADGELPVWSGWHTRIVQRLSGGHLSTQYTGDDADQQS
jgi:hypothetical protein